jgi:hypothetical protein
MGPQRSIRSGGKAGWCLLCLQQFLLFFMERTMARCEHAVSKAPRGVESGIKAQSILVQRGHKCLCKVLAARQPAWAHSAVLLGVEPNGACCASSNSFSFSWKGQWPAVNTQWARLLGASGWELPSGFTHTKWIHKDIQPRSKAMVVLYVGSSTTLNMCLLAN